MREYWGKIVTYVFYVLVAIFFMIYIKNINFNAIKKLNIKYQFLFITLLLNLLVRFLMPLAWITLIKEYSGKIKNINALFYVYAKSWLGRYIPGKIAWIGGKIFFGAKQKIGKDILAISSFLEAGMQIFSALLLGPILILFSGNFTKTIDPKTQLFMSASLLILLTLLFPSTFNRIIQTAYQLIKHKKLNKEYKLKLNTLLKIVCLLAFLQLTGGIAFSVIVKSIGIDITFSTLLFLSGTIIFSIAVGMLAMFAPSGIGARESIQAILLTKIISKEQAIVVVVLSRVIITFADILFFGISWLAIRKND